MKTLFGMTAAVLLVVMMLFVAVPGIAQAAGKVSLTEMVSIKKAADEAAQAAKAQLEKARTAEEKLLAKQLLKQAEINAEVAGELLEAVKAGKDVSREEAKLCAAIAKTVHEAAGALAAGNMAKAEDVLDRIARMSSNLPTAANARGEMQGADGAGKNQSLTAEDIKKRKNDAKSPPELDSPCESGDHQSWPKGKPFCKGGVMCQKFDNYICSRLLIDWSLIWRHSVETICTNKKCDDNGNELACTCTGGGGASAAPMNPAASFVFARNCVKGQVVEDSCRYPSPSAPNNCPCPAR